MTSGHRPESVRVLYSFPHKIGAARICHTAWHQVNGLAQAGVQVVLFTGAVSRPLTAAGTGAHHAEGHLRIGLLGASFTTGNRGVDALAAGAVRCLLHRWPRASVFFLDYARHARRFEARVADRTVPVELVPLRFSKNPFQPNHIARLLLVALGARLVPGRLRERVLNANPWLRELQAADLLCALSGGDSFSDLYGFRRLLYVALPQLLVLLLRKPLVLLPQSLGPFRTPWARALARLILRRAAMVFTREEAELPRLRGLLGPRADRARFCPDVGFAVEPAAPARLVLAGLPDPLPPGRPLVGLNVSGLLARGGYTGRNMFGLRADYRRLVERLIEHLVERQEALVLLVPHVFGPPGSEADAPVCEELSRVYGARYPGRVGFLEGPYAHDEIRYALGRCDLFIGSRMHACIAALCQGVPTVAIAYSDKFARVLAALAEGAVVLDARMSGAGEVLHAVDRAMAGREDAHQALARQLPGFHRRLLRAFDDLASVLDSRSRRP